MEDGHGTASLDGHDNVGRDDGGLVLSLPAEKALVPARINGKQSGHKRSLSGNILARLNFLRMQPEGDKEPAPLQDVEMRHAHEGDGENNNDNNSSEKGSDESAVSSVPESAMLVAQRVSKQRKRKGSLRKTALLGTTGRLKTEGRERRNSLLQLYRAKNAEDHTQANAPPEQQALRPFLPPPDSGARSEAQSQPQLRARSSSRDSHVSTTGDAVVARDGAQLKLSLDTVSDPASSSAPRTEEPSTLTSPVISPTSQSYTSTTDDDDGLVLPNAALKRPPMPGSGSYFPAQPSLQRRRSSKKPPSPLSAVPVNAYGADEEYQYGDTEWWGWVVLIVTWIVFVVGMGSCFGLWSWAWDVGETPYAPPELEDDATLPIVGYYPALIILTGVMAWVWVVVAWVGMKYFKHAKMAGEDI